MNIKDYAIAKALFGKGNGEASGEIDINANGTYNVAKYATANVNVPTPTVKLQEKTVTENGVVTADVGYDGLSKVTVDVASSDDGGSSEDTATLNALVDGSLTEIESGAESVGDYALYNRKMLTSVSFPNAISVGQRAFANCSILENVNIPNVTSMGVYAFNFCKQLTQISLPNISSIPNYAFSEATQLTEINAPNITSVGEYAFNKTGLSRGIDFTKLIEIKANAFTSCKSITGTINAPNVTILGDGAFSSSNIVSVNFSKIDKLNTGVFYSCEKLEKGYFPNVASVNNNAFAYCYSLKKVVIGTNLTSVGYLSGTSAFTKCCHILGTTYGNYNPTGAKDGYIYVPLALVANYRVATNWATYASQIMPYVATVEELANIDGTTYDKACVGEDYVEYTYNGTAWEVYER